MIYRIMFIILSVGLFTGNALATTYSLIANNFNNGDNISNALTGATLQNFQHAAGSSTLSYSSATVGTYPCTVGPCNYLTSSSNSLDYFSHVVNGAPLDVLGDFTGSSVTFNVNFSAFSLTGFAASTPDPLYYFLFDQNDQLIRSNLISGTRNSNCGISSGVPCFSYNLYETFSNESVYRIAWAATSSAVYVDSIAYSVSEPGTLSIMGLSLLLMGIIRRRKLNSCKTG